ncbi:MAG: MerR family transcriptional regulator [Angustibacter sp.]
MAYSISETSERSGFSVETLRYYERIDLVTDVPRDSAGHRVYGDEHLAWLGMVRCLRGTGMSVQKMGEYAALSRCEATTQERLDLLRQHAAEVDARIAQMRQQRAHLDEKITGYEKTCAHGPG